MIFTAHLISCVWGYIFNMKRKEHLYHFIGPTCNCTNSLYIQRNASSTWFQ